MSREKLDQEIQSCLQSMQVMDAMYEEYARKNGLTYMSLYILETIYEQSVCTQKLISEITLYPKQTVNMVIRSFLKKGWVVLEQDEIDRRNKRIQLTGVGRVFARQIVEPYWDAASEAFSELNSEEREKMIKIWNTFSHAFAEKVQKIQGVKSC